MDEENKKIYASGAEPQQDYKLEEILAEYGNRGESESAPPESLADRSRRLVMEQLGEEQWGAVQLSSLDDVIENAVAEARPEPEESAFIPLPAPEPAPEPEPEELSEEEEALIAALQREAEASIRQRQAQPETESEPEPATLSLTDDDGDTDYAAPLGEDSPAPQDEETETQPAAERKRAHREKPGSKERFLSPLVALLALIALRRSQRSAAPAKGTEPEEAQPELPPGKAARRCTALMRQLKFRGKIATALTLVMVYITYAAGSVLPLTGALRSNPRVQYLLLLVMELSVIMAGLDIFTEGILSLFRRRPGAKTLVSASCLFSVLDALVMAVADVGQVGLPFCAVSALSMTFAIWGAYFQCSGLRSSFRVLTSSQNLYTVTGEQGLTAGEVALLKSRRSTEGFVRRSESRDFCESLFRVLSPILLVACLVLGLLASLFHGAPKTVMHCISVLSAASAAFSATLCFAMPFAVGARSLAGAGAAVAGWPGIRDIGSSRHVVITDSDMFPKGTVSLGNIRVLEGAFVDKVVSYTGSVVAASGSGLAAPFAELIRRNGYTLSKVENFEPHDGGGMTAMVNGENVCVGNTGFMNLMGIRVPRKLSTPSSIYTAINGALVGIFNVEYRATGSVQEALVTLLHSSLEPVFAIRDFNITPQLIKTRFRMPTDSFKFPAYAERYRISGAQPGEESRVAAAIAREGMGPLVDTAERGRRLFGGIRAGAIIAAAGCVFGLLMLFLMCWTQTLDVATAGNVITFMLLWLIPTAVIVWGIQR